MSGTKQAPARLSAREQARIQAALEETARTNEVLAHAAAATMRSRTIVEALEHPASVILQRLVSDAAEARSRVEALGAEIARDMLRVQADVGARVGDLDRLRHALDQQTGRIGELAQDIAEDEAAGERRRARQRALRLRSTLQQLATRLSTDASFRWVEADARATLDNGRRSLEGVVSDAICEELDRNLEHLRDRAFDCERQYHERRRMAELVEQLFAGYGFDVSSASDPPHASTADIARTFAPTDEHLLVTITARQPWERDADERQLLHLTMTTRTTSEESKDPLCIERLKDLAARARELGIELGDVLQPLPGGGYECVLSTEETVAAVPRVHARAVGQ
jgi:hypothetical protein